ncbi:MAG: DUF6470 family protein [Oscillospiraceae bacterium]|jgi:hypothetical protein|nr:DUF6470 family protein [Oscillospiraceae bacterium]
MLPRISVDQGLGRLSFQSSRGAVRPHKDSMDLSLANNFVKVNLDIEHVQVTIDQTECFATSGLKTPIRLALDWCKRGAQAATEAIGKIASEGKEFVRIERDSKPIQSQARRIGYKDATLTVVSMPSVRPDINFQMGTVEVDVEGGAEFDWNPSRSEGSYTPAQVSGGWLERPYIQITVVPKRALYFPPRENLTGQSVDVRA